MPPAEILSGLGVSLADLTIAQIVARSRVLLAKTDVLLEQLEGQTEDDGFTILEELEATLRYHLLTLQRLTAPGLRAGQHSGSTSQARSGSRAGRPEADPRLMMRVSTAVGGVHALTGAYAVLEALAAEEGDTERLELAERHRRDLLKLGVELQVALPRLLAAALSARGTAEIFARMLSRLDTARAAVSSDRQLRR